MISETRRGLCLAVARKTLAMYTSAGGSIGPPVPIEKLATWLGYQVVPLRSVDHACSAVVIPRQKLIGVNARHHLHRRRFSLGHEMGHLLLRHPPEGCCAEGEIAICNAEADVCAAELLMPESLLKEWLTITQDCCRLADAFLVSEQAMRRRVGAEERQDVGFGM